MEEANLYCKTEIILHVNLLINAKDKFMTLFVLCHSSRREVDISTTKI